MLVRLMNALSITARRLREMREAKGLHQEDLAEYLGITRTAYNKYEAGVIYPVRKVKELAKFFHVTTDYILGYPEASWQVQLRQADARTRKQVEKYLRLSAKGKDIVDTTLDAVCELEAKKKLKTDEGDMQ